MNFWQRQRRALQRQKSVHKAMKAARKAREREEIVDCNYQGWNQLHWPWEKPPSMKADLDVYYFSKVLYDKLRANMTRKPRLDTNTVDDNRWREREEPVPVNKGGSWHWPEPQEDIYKTVAANIWKGPAVKIIEFRLPSKRLPQEVTKCGVKEEALFRAFNEAFGVTPEKLCALGRQTRYGNITVRCTSDQFAAFILLRARYGAENWVAELDAGYLNEAHRQPNVMLDVTVDGQFRTAPNYAGHKAEFVVTDGLDNAEADLHERARKFAADFTSAAPVVQTMVADAYVAGAKRYGPLNYGSRVMFTANPDDASAWMRPFFEGSPEHNVKSLRFLVREMADAIQPGGMFSSTGMIDWKKRAHEALSAGQRDNGAATQAFERAVRVQVDLRTKTIRMDTLKEIIDLIRMRYNAARNELSGRVAMRHNAITMQKINFLKRVGTFFLANYFTEAETKAWKRETSGM